MSAPAVGPSPLIVVDAAVAAKLVLPEELSARAHALCAATLRSGGRIVGPPLLPAEVATILLQQRRAGEISGSEADAAYAAFLDLGIEILHPPDLDRAAFAFARANRLRSVQPAVYAVLAHLIGAQLWTGDRSLLKALGPVAPWLRWIGDVET